MSEYLDIHKVYLHYLVYILVSDNLLSFSNITLEYDHKDEDNSPYKH